jgi:hypothetical protein
MFHRWVRQQEAIKSSTNVLQTRICVAGRKPLLEDLEYLISDEVTELRIQGFKVTRLWITDRAKMLALEYNIEDFKASNHWMNRFFERFGMSLRSATNLTTLTVDQLLSRAVDYLTNLRSKLDYMSISKTLLINETAVYFNANSRFLWSTPRSSKVSWISISKLCNDYDFLTLFDKKRALILDRILLYTTTLEHATVVAAGLHSDNLYHTNNLWPLLHEKYRS